MRMYVEMVFCLIVLALAALFIVSASGQSKDFSTAERKLAIELCEGAGGIPVVIAGVLNSRGIACAQPLGQ
jgi:hypothetical protein